MIRRILLAMVLVTGLCACSTTPGLFNAQHFGNTELAGGELQLFFSNPEYNTTNEQVDRDDARLREIFGKKSGSPVVVGGVGVMQIWRF
ncbi:MAG: hypothetical protein ABFD97_19860 [Syntrophobacter sp.]